MSLKQKIEEAYTKRSPQWYDKLDEEDKNKMPANNYAEVVANFKKLKEDLCKFADRFDKSLTVNAKILTGESFDGMYKDIKENLVNRIAQGHEGYFAYVAKESETLPQAIQRIKSKYSNIIKQLDDSYKNLKTDFEKAKDLIYFFAQKCNEFAGNCRKIPPLSSCTPPSFFLLTKQICGFTNSVLAAMYNELATKEKEIILLAKDKEYFYDENDYSYFSRLSRERDPDGWSRKGQVAYDRHTVEPVTDGVKIFPTPTSPNPHEVKQAGVQDCYLMAPLMALAKTKPQSIKDCFVQGLSTIENAENIAVRLFYMDKTTQRTCNVKIIVNKKRVIMPQRIKNGALWPKLVEKAYAVYRAKGYEIAPGTSKLLDNGHAGDVMFAITGEISKNSYLRRHKEKFKPKKIIDTIENKLKNSQSLVCSFQKTFTINDVKKSDERIEIKSHHNYAIVGVNRSPKEYIRLIEPNKSWGRSALNSPKSNEGGHIAMSFDDFKNNFRTIDYTTGKPLPDL